jgi:hypothetical protein
VRAGGRPGGTDGGRGGPGADGSADHTATADRRGGGIGRRPTLLAVALALLLALAGCADAVGYQGAADPGTPDTADRVGWVDGYAHDDELTVTTDDGLNRSERRAVVARTMARVEVIRNATFDERVGIEVISRAEFRERNVSFVRHGDERFERWRDVVWRAPFLVGDDRDAGAVHDDLFAGAVLGYYAYGSDRLVVVSDETPPRLDSLTLAHELTHALQDQRGWTVDRGETLDSRLAATGLVEGDAVAVERAYSARCGEEWSCLPASAAGPADVDAVVRHQGVYLVRVQPYVAGARFVADRRERGGWDAVTTAYDRPPASTAGTTYPGRYPDADRPANVTVPDRSSDAWGRYEHGGETLGQAAIHTMFWSHGLVDREDDAISTDYRDRWSRNWTGDTVVPYANGDDDAYVWRIRFDTPADARSFRDGYDRMLRVHVGARARGDGTYSLEGGPFAGAYRVTRDGANVTIVHAPSAEELEAVHG